MEVLGNALMTIDREKILKQLARVMNQMAESEETVARHRKAVAELESDVRHASLARKMLKYAEHVQTIHLAEQQRLEKMLGDKINAREKMEV
jgi:multidrug resistance efflux pump